MERLPADRIVGTREEANAEDPRTRSRFHLLPNNWEAIARACDQIALESPAGTPPSLRYPLDEIVKQDKVSVKRLVLDIDQKDTQGDVQALVAGFVRAWCTAVSSLFTVPSELNKTKLHSLWWTACRPGKLSLHAIWPLIGHKDLGFQLQMVNYLQSKVEPAYRHADTNIYGFGQLRVPCSPNRDLQFPLQYLGEYDGDGNGVGPGQRYAKNPYPPWRARGDAAPSFSARFQYSTWVSHWGDHAPWEPPQSGQGFRFHDEFLKWRRKRELSVVSLDSHPIHRYWGLEDGRRAQIDMRDQTTFWDPIRSMKEVTQLLYRTPVFPYRDAVEYLNQRFALQLGGARPLLYVKVRCWDKDLEGWYIGLHEIGSGRVSVDPADWFNKSNRGSMVTMRADPDPLIFPELQDKEAESFPFFTWYLRHRLGVRVVSQCLFRPLPPNAELHEEILNKWQGFAGHGFQRRTAGEVRKEKHAEDSELATILKHVTDIFCRGDQEKALDFHMAVAHMLRKPADKFDRCSVLNGTEGTGKTLFFTQLVGKGLMGLGRHWMITHSSKDLIGDWTSHLEDKIMVAVEESEFQASNRQGTAILQQLITGEMTMMHKKFQDAYMAALYICLFLLTNYDRPLSVNLSNRRFDFLQCDPRPMHWDAEKNNAYFNRLVKAFQSQRGREFYWGYLNTLDIDTWRANPKKPASLYTIEQGIRAMNIRQECAPWYWMWEKLQAKDFGKIGKVMSPRVNMAATKVDKVTQKIAIENRYIEVQDSSATWGSRPNHYVVVSSAEAYEDFRKVCRRAEVSQSAFEASIKQAFRPYTLPSLNHSGSRWLFGTLALTERMFEVLLPKWQGFTFQRYRDYVMREEMRQKQLMIERGLGSEVHDRSKRKRDEQDEGFEEYEEEMAAKEIEEPEAQVNILDAEQTLSGSRAEGLPFVPEPVSAAFVPARPLITLGNDDDDSDKIELDERQSDPSD